MADQEVNGSYNYPTSILTETLPEKAALILPNGLNKSQQLNEKLTSWFKNYNNCVISYNNQLKEVLQEGSKLINDENKPGFSSFYKYWNCLLTSLQLEIQTNDLLIKNFSLDIVSPLSHLTDEVKFSELLFNSQELREIVDDISKKKPNSEIQWNYKAPQIFQNFENFKSDEIQLLFNIVLNYFQIYNAKLAKNLQNNENSSNYLISNFKLEGEMKDHLNYILKTEFESVDPYGNQIQQQQQQMDLQKHGKKKSQPLPAPPIQTPQREKRQSRIKLKVGSLFGRKKKSSKASTSESIAENESLHSMGSRPTIDELIVSSRLESRRRSDVSSRLYTNTIQEEQESKIHTPSFYTKPNQQDAQESNSSNRFDSNFNSSQHSQKQSMKSFQALEPTQKSDKPAPPTPPATYNKNSGDKSSSSWMTSSNPSKLHSPPPPPPHSSHKDDKYSIGSGVVGGVVGGAVAATAGAIALKPHSDHDHETQIQSTNEKVLNREDSGSPNQSNDPFGANGNYSSTSDVSERNGNVALPTPPPTKNSTEAPLASSTINNVKTFEPPATPKNATHAFNDVDESPNFTKFNESESSDSDEELAETARNRLSMLQRHDIAEEDESRSSQFDPNTVNRHLDAPRLSNDKYSFEVGDENRINAREGSTDMNSEFLPQKKEELKQIPVPISNPSPSNKPAPPPSRKVVQHPSDSSAKSRSDINSQNFLNLTQARDSIIAPRRDVGSIGTIPVGGLIAQDTGNSLSRQDLFKHFDTTNYVSTAGLNTSIAEVINASFKDGKIVKSQIVGEVAFNYKLNESDDVAPTEPILLSIPNSFNRLILNHDIMEDLGNNMFKLSPVAITSKTLGGLKYLVNLQESQTPIIIQQIWKYEDHQASLMINLKLNSSIKTKVTLENLVVTVALKSDVESTSASSKPQGSFNKEKSRITWRYNQPLILGGNGPHEEKLIARFMTKGKASEHESGIQIKFQIHDSPIKNTSIIDYDQKKEVPGIRSLISGNYSGHE